MITVEELVDGEVSPWMVEVAREGDQFEVRGPFGGWFVWDAARDRAAAADRRRLRAGAADVDAAPSPQRGLEAPGEAAGLARARPTTCSTRASSSASAPTVVLTYTRRAPARLDGLRAPRRPRDAAGGRAARRAHVRLRADRVRGDGGQRPRRPRPRGPANIRTERFGALRLTMEHLDGNAAAGELSEVFALDGDRRRSRPAPAAATTGRVADGDGLRGRHGHRPALPGVRQRAAALVHARDELRMEMRGVRVLRWQSVPR